MIRCLSLLLAIDDEPQMNRTGKHVSTLCFDNAKRRWETAEAGNRHSLWILFVGAGPESESPLSTGQGEHLM